MAGSADFMVNVWFIAKPNFRFNGKLQVHVVAWRPAGRLRPAILPTGSI
jgi:hypothetical protein